MYFRLIKEKKKRIRLWKGKYIFALTAAVVKKILCDALSASDRRGGLMGIY